MLIHLFILLFLKTCIETTYANVGSVLFDKRIHRECFNDDEVAKLCARKIFENLSLPPVTPDQINAKYIKDAVRYYRTAFHVVDKNKDRHTVQLLKHALADTVGAHLRSELLPTVRFAYYAGYVPYRSARQVHDFLEDLKLFLNTQGLGWHVPSDVPQWANLTVGKILIGSGKYIDPCIPLVVKRDDNSCIHLPTPKLDDEDRPAAIALPFKRGGFVSLSAPKSENILLKYYTTASRCILSKSPEQCRHSDFVSFNNELWHWMKRDVAPHLMDEKLYTAFGGVLRIAAAVQNYGKGLSRRNLYDYDDPGDKKWLKPWKMLTETNFNFEADWTPVVYVSLVLATAIIIILLQLCYSYVFGQSKGCRCHGKSSQRSSKIAFAKVGPNFPTEVISSSPMANDSRRSRHTIVSKSRSACVGTARTERVYDLNENVEKYMPVILSDGDGSVGSLTSSTQLSDRCIEDIKGVSGGRTRSPPRLQTPISQKTMMTRTPMYSTSTVTRSEVTYSHNTKGGRVTDTMWSGTGSSSTENSITSTSSKSQTRRTKSSRDLAWARRVVSHHSLLNQTSKSDPSNQPSITTMTRPS